MAAGDRKIRLIRLSIPVPASGGNILAEIQWELWVENRIGEDVYVIGSNLSLDLGLPAAALPMTLAQIRTAALSKLNSDATVPPHDSAT